MNHYPQQLKNTKKNTNLYLPTKNSKLIKTKNKKKLIIIIIIVEMRMTNPMRNSKAVKKDRKS